MVLSVRAAVLTAALVTVMGLAAQTAYYFFFSLFPIMLFITPMLSFFGNEQEIVSRVLGSLGQAIPPGFNALRPVVRQLQAAFAEHLAAARLEHGGDGNRRVPRSVGMS